MPGSEPRLIPEIFSIAAARSVWVDAIRAFILTISAAETLALPCTSPIKSARNWISALTVLRLIPLKDAGAAVLAMHSPHHSICHVPALTAVFSPHGHVIGAGPGAGENSAETG